MEGDKAYPKSILFLSADECRSSMAAAVLINVLHMKCVEDQWYVDSASLTPVHEGELLDARATKCLANHKIFNVHRCRTVKPEDFTRFNFIICIDDVDLALVNYYKPENLKKKIRLLGSYHPDDRCKFQNTSYSLQLRLEKQVKGGGKSLRELENKRLRHEKEVESMKEDIKIFENFYTQCFVCCSTFVWQQLKLLSGGAPCEILIEDLDQLQEPVVQKGFSREPKRMPGKRKVKLDLSEYFCDDDDDGVKNSIKVQNNSEVCPQCQKKIRSVKH